MEYQGRKIGVNSIDMNVVIGGEGPDVLHLPHKLSSPEVVLTPRFRELVIPGGHWIAGAVGLVNLLLVSWIRAARRNKTR